MAMVMDMDTGRLEAAAVGVGVRRGRHLRTATATIRGTRAGTGIGGEARGTAVVEADTDGSPCCCPGSFFLAEPWSSAARARCSCSMRVHVCLLM